MSGGGKRARHGEPKPSSGWSDIAARVVIVAVIAFVIWLVRIRLG